MIRKNIYRWHRILSLIAAVPMILWSGSGMLHQAGQWVKPKLKKEVVALAPVDSSAIKISLQYALQENRIEKITASQIVKYRGEYFYQVRVKKNNPCVYLGVKDGQQLDKGDERFAVALAFEMMGNENAHIAGREFIKKFTEHYRSSAKVLPVYELMINDADHTMLYIDTWDRKLTFSSNKQKHAFHTWFGYLHSWKFLDPWKNIKIAALVLFSLIAFTAAVAGIYLYLLLPAIGREKRAKNVINRRRNYHRWVGIIASFSMLLFAFSGALHAFIDFLPAGNTQGDSWHKTVFNQLHLFRFTNAVSKDFRFWLLMLFAFINLLTVVTGLVLVTRLVAKRSKEKKEVKRVLQPAFIISFFSFILLA